jgi:hypothetical protein
VINTSNYQYKKPPVVTHTHDNIQLAFASNVYKLLIHLMVEIIIPQNLYYIMELSIFAHADILRIIQYSIYASKKDNIYFFPILFIITRLNLTWYCARALWKNGPLKSESLAWIYNRKTDFTFPVRVFPRIPRSISFLLHPYSGHIYSQYITREGWGCCRLRALSLHNCGDLSEACAHL